MYAEMAATCANVGEVGKDCVDYQNEAVMGLMIYKEGVSDISVE